VKGELNILKNELKISYTGIISQEVFFVTFLKHYKCSLLWCVNNTWIKFLSQDNSS